jgi:radical SAM superfamily enzyme YgiQ (UPF0313 family)
MGLASERSEAIKDRFFMKIALLFPPYANIRTVHLSLPSLSAFLKAMGHEVILRDLNLDFFYHSLNEDAVKDRNPDTVDQVEWVKALPRLLDAKKNLFDENTPPGNDPKEILKWAYDRIFRHHEFYLNEESLHNVISSIQPSTKDSLSPFFDDVVLPWLRRKDIHVVGITVPYPNQISPSFRLARQIKAALPHTFIVLGGPQITKISNDVIGNPELFRFIDALVVCEGEKALKLLLESLEGTRDLSKVPNLIYPKRGRVICNPHLESEPMNTLPTPDFSGLPLRRYLLKEMMLPVITSRGCYWSKCVFCTYREIHTQRLEFRDIPFVVQDMRRLAERYRCESIRIVDDALSPKRCHALSRKLLDEKIQIQWRCSARMEKGFTSEICQIMRQAGCVQVGFGLESYNQRILDLMKKGTQVAEVIPLLKRFKDAGIRTHLNLMIGFPTETRKEAGETMRFLDENRHLYHSFGVQTFNLESGTDIDRYPEQFGITEIKRGEKRRYGFRYGYHFETEHGMSREEAEAFTEALRNLKKKGA